MNNIPELIMLVGIAGSGKSTYAQSLKSSYIIHSSDNLREEIYGNVNENSKECNTKLFTELHKRIKRDLIAGKDVIYDATNLNRKKRITFLNEIKNIDCHKTCVVVACPYYICLINNQMRDRKVPENIIKRMYMNFQPPHKSEGWDDIDIMFSCAKEDFADFNLATLYNHATGIDYINQGNKHHLLTLGEHSRRTAKYILEHFPNNQLLHLAALLHDEGKIFTMTTENTKGEKDGNCHYYQHNCVGAYDAIFYMYNMNYRVDDIIHVSTLIYFHMLPYQCSEEQLKKKIGEKISDEILALFEADKSAH